MNKAEERAQYLGYGTDPLNRAEYTANEVRDAFIEGYHEAEKDLVLDSLFTVKEVDLEKEYDNEFFKDPVFGKLVNRNAGISIAKHFFELGLKYKDGYEQGYADAIEKACELLMRMVWEVTYEDLEGNSVQNHNKMEFIEEIRNFMKGGEV